MNAKCCKTSASDWRAFELRDTHRQVVRRAVVRRAHADPLVRLGETQDASEAVAVAGLRVHQAIERLDQQAKG